MKFDAAELQRLYEATTQGEWMVERADDENMICHEIDCHPMKIHIYEDLQDGYANNKHDAEFIAAIHNAFPAILEHIAGLEKRVEELDEALQNETNAHGKATDEAIEAEEKVKRLQEHEWRQLEDITRLLAEKNAALKRLDDLEILRYELQRENDALKQQLEQANECDNCGKKMSNTHYCQRCFDRSF